MFAPLSAVIISFLAGMYRGGGLRGGGGLGIVPTGPDFRRFLCDLIISIPLRTSYAVMEILISAGFY